MEETENEEELLFKPPVSVQYRCPRSPPCGTDAPRATVVCPLGSSARTSAWSPERCLSSKSAQALHRAGKVVMGASRSQAGGRRGERGEALGKGSALSGGTCPSAGGQGHPSKLRAPGASCEGCCRSLAGSELGFRAWLRPSCSECVGALAVCAGRSWGCWKTASGPGWGEEGFPEGASPDRDPVGISALTLSPRAKTLLLQALRCPLPLPWDGWARVADPASGAASSSSATPPHRWHPHSQGGGGGSQTCPPPPTGEARRTSLGLWRVRAASPRAQALAESLFHGEERVLEAAWTSEA